jgi:ABC-2 type transport system permease protein
MNSIRLYIQFVRLSIRSQMVYKASFIFGSIGHFFITVIEFVGILALFDRFGGINGWTLPEIALFYGTVNASFALAESFGRGYDLFSHQVVSGRFDRLILRPRSFMLQLMGVEVQLIRVGRLLQGLAIMIWACVTLHINLS